MNLNTTTLLMESKTMQLKRLSVKFHKIIISTLILILFGTVILNYHSKIHKQIGQHRFYEGQFTNLIKSLVDINSRFVYRRERVNEKCKKFNLNDKKYTVHSREFVINYNYHLIWCNVFKAASSSWIYNFNLLAGYSPKYLNITIETPVSLLRQKYARPSDIELLDALVDNLSFLIVRHPLERLISAYRNKFSSNKNNQYFKKIGRNIIYATRFIEKNMTFGTHYKYPPTFREFIIYIICQWRTGQNLDEHWVPITQFCSPCQVPFDIIIKFETLHQDQNYLIKLAKLQDIIHPTWINNAMGAPTKDMIEHYYSQLSKQQIQLLSEVYKYDLELFEYSIDDYLTHGHADDGSSLPCN